MAPRCVLGRIPHITGTGKWPPYGGSSLDAEVFHPLEHIEPVFNAFQWDFYFHLTTISLLEQIILVKEAPLYSCTQTLSVY